MNGGSESVCFTTVMIGWFIVAGDGESIQSCIA